MTRHPCAERPAPPRRGGGVALEFILVLPILTGVVLAIVQMSMMSSARQRLVAASAQGARVAAQGGDIVDVDEAVRRHLGGGRLAAAEVRALLTDDDLRPLVTGDTVEVVVRIPAEKAVPDLLRFVGVSIKGRTLAGRTALRKE